MSVLAVKIIEKYYKKNSDAFRILTEHSRAVSKKAVAIAGAVRELSPDVEFIKEASMLHDIGIFLTNAPDIDCYGEYDYLMHGVLGRELLEKEGLMKHALVCERHIGVGISLKQIIEEDLPLPKREMVSETIEEEIIALADNFFGKSEKNLTRERSVEEVRERIKKHGEEKLNTLNQWFVKYKIISK